MPHDCKLGTCLVSEQRHAHARASLLLIICSIHFNRLLACLLPTALSLSLSVCLSLCSVFFFSGVRGQGGVGDRGPDGRDPRRLGPGAGGWVGGSINQHKEWPACRPCPKPCHACMHVANRQFKQLIKSAPCACMHACMHAPSSHTQGPMLCMYARGKSPIRPVNQCMYGPSSHIHTTQGYALTCCSHPQTDVAVKCIPEDELIDEQFSR